MEAEMISYQDLTIFKELRVQRRDLQNRYLQAANKLLETKTNDYIEAKSMITKQHLESMLLIEGFKDSNDFDQEFLEISLQSVAVRQTLNEVKKLVRQGSR